MPIEPTDPPEIPTTPGQLSPEARDALALAALQYLVAAEQRRAQDRGYLRSLAESPVLGRVRLDQLVALVLIAAAAAALGLNGPTVWALVTGGAPAVAAP